MPSTRSKAKPAPARRSLSQFALDQRRAGCPVCALPADVLAEVRSASRRKIPRAVVLEWLHVEHGAKVTAADIAAHVNARHDNGEG